MFNWAGKGLIISVLIHLVLILLLSQQFRKTQESIPINKEVHKKSIKSFLYTPIYKKPINEPAVFIGTKPHKIPAPSSITSTKKEKSPSSKHTKNSIYEQNTVQKQIKSDSLPSQKIKTITAQKLKNQLNKLRLRQNNNYGMASVKPSNSHIQSVFNPNPPVVSKSTSQTEQQIEAEKKLKITNYGSTTIKKNKNGYCSVTQDLTLVGISGVSSKQFFTCGKSEFDKNFSKHMKNVMKKYK